MSRTIFDDVFRTMVEKLPYLAVPLINEVFETSYPENVEITQLRNEHQQENGEIITDSCLKIAGKLYHIECQSLDDETVYEELTNRTLTGIGDVGTPQSGDTTVTISGFTYDHSMVKTTGEFVSGNEGVLSSEYLLEIRLYYNRNSYPYEVRYLEEGTNKVLHEPKEGSGKYGARVKELAETIPGYTPKKTEDYCTIKVQPEGEGVAKVNVITFYYTENEVQINYVAVGPDGKQFGSVAPGSEKVKVLTGTPGGSTPTANDGFRFVGWFKDADCKQPVDATWVANNKLTPGKTVKYGEKDGYEAATYYAKFEPDVADLTISKQGCEAIDENQSFIFTVTGEGLPPAGLKVVVTGNGSVTITGLKVGTTYTITEDTGWSWRYKPEANGQEHTMVADKTQNTVTFTNERTEPKWLNGCSIEVNNWKKKADEESSKTN